MTTQPVSGHDLSSGWYRIAVMFLYLELCMALAVGAWSLYLTCTSNNSLNQTMVQCHI